MDAPAPGSLRRDIATAYLATGARILSWVVVTAVVYRRLGKEWFAVLALTRTTIGLLNYTTLGLAPAMIRMLAIEGRPKPVLPVFEGGQALDYAPRRQPGGSIVYSSAVALGALLAVAGAVVARTYAGVFDKVHALPPGLAHFNPLFFVFTLGVGTVFRLGSDSAGAALQVRHKIPTDNLLLAGAEVLWMGLCLNWVGDRGDGLDPVGGAWLVSGQVLLLFRLYYAHKAMGRGAFSFGAIRFAAVRQLLAFGLMVAAAQAADFLYAPTDNILINKLIDPVTVAVYAPAVQIDAGLLLLVSGLAAVLLPRGALAHAGGDAEKVRRYYVLGTAASVALLVPAALLAWTAAPLIFRAWLHDPLPATVAILPLVLIHTVVGGSSAVGRSILLATGKVKPFTAAVLIAGAGNVMLSYAFVKYAGLGLRGIILGTIVAVVVRCAAWTPWFVLRTLRRETERMEATEATEMGLG